jgi:AAA family ATP:ADP antiporter
MLYQAKTVIDTLFVRVGDGLAALTVLIGTRLVSLELGSFLVINIGLVVVWLGLALFLARENRRIRPGTFGSSADPAPAAA